MNKYYIQYHSRTLASLQNRKDQQSAKRSMWAFEFPTTSVKVALSDNIKRLRDFNLHTGLNMVVHLGAPSLEGARVLSKQYAEMLLRLVSFSTLASCDPAGLVSLIDVTNQDEFPARFSTHRLGQEELMEPLIVMDASDFGALFQAYNTDDYPDPDRVARALMWLRKGITEREVIDEFICYWTAIEMVSSVLRDKLRFEVKDPQLWDGIRSILVNKVKYDDFDGIYQARQGLLHGFRELNNEFREEIRAYIQPMIKSLVFAVGDILKLDKHLTEAIVDKAVKKSPVRYTTVLEGTLKNLSSDFERITKDYPSVEVQSSDTQFSLGQDGNVTATLEPTHTFHFGAGVVFSVHRLELWRG